MSDDIKLCSKCGTDNIEQHACEPFVVRETYGGEPDGKTYYVAVHDPTGFCFTGRASRGEAVQDARIANSVLRTESSRLRAELAEAREALKPFADAFTPYPPDAEPGFVKFLDANTITPSMCMGDFRRAAEAAKKAGGGA